MKSSPNDPANTRSNGPNLVSGTLRFEQHEPPEHVLLTNRHHDRHAWRLREAFGCTVHCIRNGLHELEGRGPVEAFDFGDELPGGAVAFEVDAICPDETALYIAARRALACASCVCTSSRPPALPRHRTVARSSAVPVRVASSVRGRV